ncbi:MAG: hypothetical protein SOT69_10835 [Mesosutterella sp.]|nr:hypothetical protein [Mesosutterella sp.]
MATSVDICNQALAMLGDPASVSSIDPPDGSPQAGHCSRWYPIALRRLLEEHAWSFATVKATPSQLADEKLETSGFQYAFAVPSQCIRILGVEDSTYHEPMEFIAMRRDNVPAILTNQPDPVMTYVTYVDSPAIFPNYFIDALVVRLAAYLVGPLRRSDASSQTAVGLLKLYEQALSEAKTADSLSGVRRQDKYVAAQLRARRV